jgi:hypothetical protein
VKCIFGICAATVALASAVFFTASAETAQPGTTMIILGVNCFVEYDPKGGDPVMINEAVVVEVRWNAKRGQFDMTILESAPHIIPC